MAKEYFEKLTDLVEQLEIKKTCNSPVEIKHFFSGAAFYVNSTICASWSPAGLAFKLPEQEVAKLISNGSAKPLKYFAKGHIKKGYALFENPDPTKVEQWKHYFIKAIEQTNL